MSYNVSFDKIFNILNYQPRKKIIDGVLEIKDVINKGTNTKKPTINPPKIDCKPVIDIK